MRRQLECRKHNERIDVMKGKPPVVVYGASGYTGKLIIERLAGAGIPFVAAGRDKNRLNQAVADLPNAKKAQAQIASVEHDARALATLFDGAKVVANVTGPFGQLGRPVADAAFAARCHYIDTTGETDWIKTLRDEYGPRFASEKLTLCPALAYMWAAGQMAAELALETKGIDSLDIVYSPGSAPTIASTLSFMRMVTRTQYRLVNRTLDPWPAGASILNTLPHAHEVVRSLPWGGGAEPVWYEHDPRVRNCRVTVGIQNSQMVDWLLNCAAEFAKVAGSKSEAELEALTNTWGQTIASTPPRENLDANRSVISCKARGPESGKEVVLYGAAPYEQTGVLIAEGARRLLESGAKRVGFHSPASAFGHRKLIGALAAAGLHQSAPVATTGKPTSPRTTSPQSVPVEVHTGH
jgi:NAD(P)-dependent dehydrogenase (short-subunit alcohol dehydrogenase family)